MNKELIKNENLENELIEAMNDLADAHKRILNVLDCAGIDSKIDSMINDSLNQYYPYHVSFDDLYYDVLQWKQSFSMYLEGKSLEEIKKELEY